MAKKKSANNSLPEDVIPIHNFLKLPERDLANVCGVIVGFRPVKKSRGTDYQVEIVIQDIYEDPETDRARSKPNTLTTKLFGGDPAFLPPVDRTGDVIFFRRLKAAVWSGQLGGLSAWDTSWVMFPIRGLLDSNLRHGNEVVNPHGIGNAVRPPGVGDVSREMYEYANTVGNRLQMQRDAMAAPNGPASLAARPPPMTSPQWQDQRHHYPTPRTTPQWQNQPYQYQPPGTTPQWQNQWNQPPPPEMMPQRQDQWHQAPLRPTHIQPDSFYDSRYSQIKDLTDRSYSATLIGEIVKMFDTYGNYLDVYLTDYTSSPLLYDRKDAINTYSNRAFPGPLGRMTLKVELHNPHRDAARGGFMEKSIVMLRNVRCKMANSGEGLEGTLWPDRKYEDKVHILAPDPHDGRVLELQVRRQAYYGIAQPGNAFAALNGNGDETEKVPTKTQRKREKKQRRERERMEAEKAGENVKKPAPATEKRDEDAQTHMDLDEPMIPENDHVPAEDHEQPDGGVALHARPSWANPRIRTTSTHQFSPFNEVLHNLKRQIVIPNENGIGTALMEVPFINVNHRVLLRIVDYTPKDVWSFAQPIQSTEVNTASRKEIYEWSLTLLVTDGNPDSIPEQSQDGRPETMTLNIDNSAGETLFGLPARALIYDEDDQKALAKAQEKFFALVGSELPNAKEAASLEGSEENTPTKGTGGRCSGPRFPFWERRKASAGERAMSMPFEACVAEYGVRCEHDGEENGDGEGGEGCEHCVCGWRRCYGLHSTTVVEEEKTQEAQFRRETPARGLTVQDAIVLDDSEPEAMDVT